MTPPDGPGSAPDTTIVTLLDRVLPDFKKKYPADKISGSQRVDVARDAKQTVAEFLGKNRIGLNLLDQRDLVTALVNATLGQPETPPSPSAVTQVLSPPAEESAPPPEA